MVVKIIVIKKKTWKHFKDCGMLWWINMILHTMGWAITYEYDKHENILEVYPARVKFRGIEEFDFKGVKFN